MSSFEQHIQNLTDSTQPSGARRTAVATLAAQGDARAVPYLLDALADTDSMVRREATKALQHLNATAATEPILRALETEPNDLTVWAMLEAIGELGTPRVLPTLQAFQNVTSLLTRMEATKSVARIEARFPDGEPAPQEQNTAEIEPPEEEDTSESEYIETVFSPNGDTEVPQSEEHAYRSEPPEPSKPLPPEDRFDNSATTVLPILEAAAPGPKQTAEAPPAQETESIEEFSVGLDEEAVPRDVEIVPEDNNEELDEIAVEEPVPRDAEIIEEDASAYEGLDEVALEEPGEITPSELEESAALEELSLSISQSSRLVGQPVILPVLAPSAPAVWHSPMGYGAPPEPPRPNVFALLLRPSTYLSKRWVSRTRVYLMLWFTLIAATLGFIRFQGRSGSELSPLSRMGISVVEAPEQVRRCLAEGDFYIQEGYYRQAISSYELGRRLGPIPIQFYKKLGFAYLKENQYALAVDAYEFFVAAQPPEPRNPFIAEASVQEPWQPDYKTYNALGTAYLKLGRMADAQRAFAQAVLLTPNDGQAYNNLAWLYADFSQVSVRAVSAAATRSLHASHEVSDTARRYCQKLRFAEALARQAVTHNPDVAAYHATLGWILAKRGHTQRAINTLSRAIRLQSDQVDAHYHLALVALKANEREKALKAIRNVLKLDPGFVHLNFRA